MVLLQRPYKFAALAVLTLSAIVSGIASFWLWREYTIFALFFTVLLIFGGAVMLPSRNIHAHAASLGFCVGAFIGGGFGAAALFSAGA